MLPRLLTSALLFSFVAFASAVPNIRILIEGDDYCNDQSILRIRQMIKEAKTLAQSAIDTLYRPNVEKSSGFVALFGPNANPKDIADKHFAPVNILPDSPAFVVTVKRLTENDLTFTCPPYGDPKDNKARMSTRNWVDGDGHDQRNNLIRIFPNSFEYDVPDSKGSHKVDTLPLQKAVEAAIAKTWFDEKAVPMAFTLVHEVQHADVIIGAENHCLDVAFIDDKGKTVKAYGLQQIQKKITNEEKVKNAQNYAWFAFLTLAQPELFTDDCQGNPGPIPHAAGLQEPLLVQDGIAPRAAEDTCKYIHGDFLNIVDTDGEF
ncbi:hypothetical protein EW026_g5280 [Hermanssonia centrifuga]|uniref:Uncharacterized protein n=1 Tax=Hermanssonia centrifuga TaxID=98765 RepID=A0A4S4KFK6_9APHY|nr:hypothetical protein EW026_g5280 [Hermanssonia centrifuga]